MSSHHFRSSRPDHWTMPRPWTDASSRYMAYGPVKPMDEERAPWGRAILIAAGTALAVLAISWWWSHG